MKPITILHEHLALIRANSDAEFLQELAKLDLEGYDLVQGWDVHYGKVIVALLGKPRQPVFEFPPVEPEPAPVPPPPDAAFA